MSRQVVQTLANVIESGVHDPRLRGITFTSAQATDDLRTVRVFFTVFGDESDRVEAGEGLKAASGYLRRELAHGLALRYVPGLHFEYDETVATAERIERLLHRDDESVSESDTDLESQSDSEEQSGDEGKDD